MTKLRLSQAARADLIDIRGYSVMEFGVEVADIYFNGFNQAFSLLRERPFIGASQPDLGRDVRCLTHRRHRIFYRVRDDAILILRVLHHTRHARSLLRP